MYPRPSRSIYCSALALLLAACAVPPPGTAPSPLGLPDSVSVPSGMVAVELVDSLASFADPDAIVVGRLMYLERRIYISRKITSPVQARKTLEHERCHVVLLDSGLQVILSKFLDREFSELLCDAFATARIAELSRGKAPR